MTTSSWSRFSGSTIEPMCTGHAELPDEDHVGLPTLDRWNSSPPGACDGPPVGGGYPLIPEVLTPSPRGGSPGHTTAWGQPAGREGRGRSGQKQPLNRYVVYNRRSAKVELYVSDKDGGRHLPGGQDVPRLYVARQRDGATVSPVAWARPGPSATTWRWWLAGRVGSSGTAPSAGSSGDGSGVESGFLPLPVVTWAP